MAEGGRTYRTQTKVECTSSEAYPQFRSWRKEVERIINGPLHPDNYTVKLNTVYIWVGACNETLVEERQAEDPTLEIETAAQLLDCLDKCLTHSIFFREAREDFYNIKQKPGDNTTTFYNRIMELFRLADFPENSDVLIVDKLIHCWTDYICKRKLVTKSEEATVKTCWICYANMTLYHDEASRRNLYSECHLLSGPNKAIPTKWQQNEAEAKNQAFS